MWLAWLATRHVVPPAVFAGIAVPVAVAAILLALGRRDGLSLDRLAAAAFRHARAPHRLVPGPEGVHRPPAWIDARLVARAGPLPASLRLPADAIGPDRVISLGDGGFAAVAAASTVNFALRTPAEQQALVAAFGRWLNSLQHPAQILVRARRIDLSTMATRVRECAFALPDPTLEAAALAHAGFLDDLAASQDLLARQVLIAVREPARELAAARIAGTARALAAADIAVTPLGGGGTRTPSVSRGPAEHDARAAGPGEPLGKR